MITLPESKKAVCILYAFNQSYLEPSQNVTNDFKLRARLNQVLIDHYRKNAYRCDLKMNFSMKFVDQWQKRFGEENTFEKSIECDCYSKLKPIGTDDMQSCYCVRGEDRVVLEASFPIGCDTMTNVKSWFKGLISDMEILSIDRDGVQLATSEGWTIPLVVAVFQMELGNAEKMLNSSAETLDFGDPKLNQNWAAELMGPTCLTVEAASAKVLNDSFGADIERYLPTVLRDLEGAYRVKNQGDHGLEM